MRTFCVRTINELLRLSASVNVVQKFKIEIESVIIGWSLEICGGRGCCRGDIRVECWTRDLACLEEEWDPSDKSGEGGRDLVEARDV